MANITIVIPDALLTLYATARAQWNPIISTQGGTLLPPATKAGLEKLIKEIVKSQITGAAWVAGKTDVEIDALLAQLEVL